MIVGERESSVSDHDAEVAVQGSAGRVERLKNRGARMLETVR